MVYGAWPSRHFDSCGSGSLNSPFVGKREGIGQLRSAARVSPIAHRNIAGEIDPARYHRHDRRNGDSVGWDFLLSDPVHRVFYPARHQRIYFYMLHHWNWPLSVGPLFQSAAGDLSRVRHPLPFHTPLRLRDPDR